MLGAIERFEMEYKSNKKGWDLGAKELWVCHMKHIDVYNIMCNYSISYVYLYVHMYKNDYILIW